MTAFYAVVPGQETSAAPRRHSWHAPPGCVWEKSWKCRWTRKASSACLDGHAGTHAPGRLLAETGLRTLTSGAVGRRLQRTRRRRLGPAQALFRHPVNFRNLPQLFAEAGPNHGLCACPRHACRRLGISARPHGTGIILRATRRSKPGTINPSLGHTTHSFSLACGSLQASTVLLCCPLRDIFGVLRLQTKGGETDGADYSC